MPCKYSKRATLVALFTKNTPVLMIVERLKSTDDF